MLKEKVMEFLKESQEIAVESRGGCRFCGQIRDIEIPVEFTEEEKDELVTELCDCAEARYYIDKKDWKERAHKKIEELFGEKSESPLEESKIKIIHDAVEPIAEYSITSISVDFGNGIKAKIGITAKGRIKTQRTNTDVKSYEA